MKISLIVALTLLLFGGFFARADVQELSLDQRAYLPPFSSSLKNGYLPPSKDTAGHKSDTNGHSSISEKQFNLPSLHNKLNKNYLPPTEQSQHHELNAIDYGKASKANSHYKYNQPKVLDDPLPIKVDYVKPLDIHYVNKKYYPVVQGAFISGIFFNIYDSQTLASGVPYSPPSNKVLNMCGEDNASRLTNTLPKQLFQSVNNGVKTKNNLDNKEFGNSPISYFTDTVSKLLHQNEIGLSGSGPVVSFKPGNGIVFAEDSALRGDCEHDLLEKEVTVNNNSVTIKEIVTTSTPTTTSPEILYKSKISTPTKATTAISSTSLAGLKKTNNSDASVTSKQSANEESRGGYIYERPKIPFTF